jgi:hypothetical protein
MVRCDALSFIGLQVYSPLLKLDSPLPALSVKVWGLSSVSGASPSRTETLEKRSIIAHCRL